MAPFGKDYFENLLAEIREIRASERKFYQKITDIYATAMDYSVDAEITQIFFATVQNKLHFAIHGRTSAELIVERADSKKEKMGLTTWKNAPHGKIIKPDVSVAKNYLTEKELKSLDRFVTMYLDYAEDQAERNIPMTMEDWAEKLNAFSPVQRAGHPRPSRQTVIAGYHWFTDWGRDTMISLEGLTLRHRPARRGAATSCARSRSYIRDGLIPNLFPEGDERGPLPHRRRDALVLPRARPLPRSATGDRDTLRVAAADAASTSSSTTCAARASASASTRPTACCGRARRATSSPGWTPRSTTGW